MFAAKNLLLTSPPPAPVAFDAVGAGTTGGGTASKSVTYSHTIGAGANCVIVGAGVLATAAATFTAKVGTTSMTQVGAFLFETASNDGYVVLFKLLNPPTGAQTMTFAVSGGTDYIAVNSVSYANVGSVGATATTNSGTSTSASLTVSAAPNDMVVQVFAANNSGVPALSFSAYNQTSRYNVTGVNSVNIGTLMGDAPGASSVSFTSTVSTSSTWGAIGVPLLPA